MRCQGLSLLLVLLLAFSLTLHCDSRQLPEAGNDDAPLAKSTEGSTPGVAGDAGAPKAATIADLVTPYGYPLEEHSVTTEDGFVLRLHRIPTAPQPKLQAQALQRRAALMAKPSASLSIELGAAAADTAAAAAAAPERPVVLLHHGLLDSAAGFLLLGPGQALGLMLADAGFDVWLSNARGNLYSRNHTFLKPTSAEFWASSFDEMAAFDLPAQLDYIQEVTGQSKAAYIGFSQGATVALAALADQPDLAARLRAAVLMAPAAFLKHASSPPLQLLATLDTPSVFKLLGTKEFLPSPALVKILEGTLCFLQPHLCLNLLAAIGGFNEKSISADKLPTYLKYTPAGSSVQNIAHWAQCMRQAAPHALSHFDWGSDCVHPRAGGATPMCNALKYGAAAPPAYQLDKITTPLMMVTGGKDKLVNAIDLSNLRKALAPGVVSAELHIPDYEHLDFIWAESANATVYTHIIDFLAALPQ